MSRYRDTNYAPPPTRWDAERFTRERDYREVDEYYQPAPPPARRPARPVYEEERVYYEDDRFGPRNSRVERQYFEEEDYYDPRVARGQVVPFRPPQRGSRQEAPPRPGLLRRQSSLDTFDRPPARRYEDIEGYRPPPRTPRINIDVPPQPPAGANRYRPRRPSGPAYYDEYDEREFYDDVAIQDPDYYGDEGFREFREREWVRNRGPDESRDRERSVSRSRPPPTERSSEVKEETKELVIRKEKEEVKEEVKEKPYPRRGKTRMPKRLVHTKVLFDLGYPFYEEGEKTIIIEKALGPDNIDEVFTKSREYRAREVGTTLRIEAPPPSAPPPRSSKSSVARSARPQSFAAPSVHESFKEDVFKETEVRTKPISEAPRSVREWDQLKVEDDSRTVRSSRRQSTKSKSRRGSSSEDDTIIEKRKSIVVEREPPEKERRRRRHRSRSRRRSRSSSVSVDETEIYKRKVTTEEDGLFEESASVHVGPLALVVDRQKEEYGERDLKKEIRRLEKERRSLQRERERGGDEVYIERRFEREVSPVRRERIVERDDDDIFIERRIERSVSPMPIRTRIVEPDSTDIIIEREQIINRGISPAPIAPIRRYERDDDEMFVERRRVDRIEEVRPPDFSETIIERRGDDVVEVRKDRRERSFSRTRAPSAGLIKGMMYTLT